MAYVTLGGAGELQIVVPTNGTTGWGDTMRTSTFLKIAQHDHTGSGKGNQLGTGSLLADAVTGAKIRLDNDEYLRARNAANTANVDLFKLDTNNDLYVDAELSKLLLKNNTYLLARNNADNANVNLLKLDTNDDLLIDPEVAKLNIKNNTNITARNNADNADVNLLKLNASDELELAPLIALLRLKNNTNLTARNNAGNADVNLIKLNTSDKIEIGASIVSSTIEALTSPSITGSGSVTLTDNTAVAADASVITLSANQCCEVKYKIARGSDIVHGSLFLDQANALINREEIGDSVGITFTLATDILKYTSTSTGNNATMTYTIIKL